MILDTSFLTSLDGDASDARSLAGDLETRGVPLRIPTIVIQELYVAVGLGSNTAANARTFEALVENKPVVPLNDAIARRAGILEGVHIGSDAKPDLGPANAVVAATALQFSEPVVTADDSDFEAVDEVEVVTP